MSESRKLFLIYFFGACKLIIHFLTNTNYNLHRDEYLYFDQGKHLAWGFYEVPPVTPFIGKLADLIGGDIFAIRLFPAIAGAIIIMLSCKLVKDLGGGTWALVLTGLSLLLTTSLLGSNSLFQPVTFNQLFWFLIAYMVFKIISNSKKNYYYMLGIIIGLSLLTKYSVIFYLIALLVGILLSTERKLLKTKFFAITIAIGFLISLPNIIWQINHGFPFFSHMIDLSDTQLIHTNWVGFLKAQLIAHKGFTIVWLFGLIGLFTIEKFRTYKTLGIAFLLTLILIGLLHGKYYYTLGAFLILFPFGGLTIEHYIKSPIYKLTIIAAAFIITLPFYPISLPVLKIDKLKKYTSYLSDTFGIDYMLRWEDDNYYDLPQDIADMHGWEELAKKTATLYHSLSKEQKDKCIIYGGSYGHASSINYYRDKYNLPEAYSFTGSHIFWANENAEFDNQILIDDRKQDSSQWFAEMTLVDSIQNLNAREKGYIYYRSKPKLNVMEEWKRIIIEQRSNIE